MTCFCDIHLKRLTSHMKKYGNFGIGLKKNGGLMLVYSLFNI